MPSPDTDSPKNYTAEHKRETQHQMMEYRLFRRQADSHTSTKKNQNRIPQGSVLSPT